MSWVHPLSLEFGSRDILNSLLVTGQLVLRTARVEAGLARVSSNRGRPGWEVGSPSLYAPLSTLASLSIQVGWDGVSPHQASCFCAPC